MSNRVVSFTRFNKKCNRAKAIEFIRPAIYSETIRARTHKYVRARIAFTEYIAFIFIIAAAEKPIYE